MTRRAPARLSSATVTSDGRAARKSAHIVTTGMSAATIRGRGEPLPLRGDQHDGLGGLVLEVLDGGAERRGRGVGDARQADEVPGLAGGHLDGDHRARRAVQLGARREHADHARAAGDQRARRGVAPVAELGDRPLDPFLRRRAGRAGWSLSTRETVWCETLRHPGDVVHPGRPRRRSVVTHGGRVPA